MICSHSPVTGFIGGTAYAHIAEAHPDFDITLLVRNEQKAEPIRARYPKARFVFGSLDDAEVLEKAAADADIVVRKKPTSIPFQSNLCPSMLTRD